MRWFTGRFIGIAAFWSCLAVAAISLSPAQEKETAPPPAVKQRLRLPAYFGRVVTQQQREEIYDILRDFEERLQPLRKELQELAERRDRQIADVLTKEQLAEVERYRDEARRLRSKPEESPPAAGENDGEQRPAREEDDGRSD